MAPKKQPRSAAAGTAAAATTTKPNKIAEREAAILDQVASRSCKVCSQVRVHLEPGNGGHAEAKHMVPFVNKFLKQCALELGSGATSSDLDMEIVDDFFNAMDTALDCLEKLRTWLVGNPLEVEFQRYTVIRKLMAWKRFTRALEECRKIMVGLNAYIKSISKNVVPQLLPPPPRVPSGGLTSGLPSGLDALVVGVACDFTICAIDCGKRNPVDLRDALALPCQLEPWLRIMDPETSQKQRMSFYRTLFRAAHSVTTDDRMDPDVAAAFCKAVLQWCLSSSVFDQYAQIGRKLCCNLFATPPLVNVGLDVSFYVVSELQSQMEKSGKCDCKFLSTDAQIEELRWLISAIYNIGVHHFNRRNYDSAIKPLELCFEITWLRVDALWKMSAVKLIPEGVSEACSKTSVLADAFKRRSPCPEEPTKVLIKGLRRWITAHSHFTDLDPPRSLLRLWRMLSLAEPTVVTCLYTALTDIHTLFPASIGLLLEEYLALLDEESAEQEELLKILINDVYQGDRFALERSRMLVEKSRLVRKLGIDNLNTSILLLTEAVMLMVKALSRRDASEDSKSRLKYYLAAAFCLRAQCTQEADPLSQDYVQDVTAALKLWKDLLMLEDHAWSSLWSKLQGVEGSLRLLSSIADLMSLKGNAKLMLQVQQTVIGIGRKMGSSTEEQLSFLAHSRLSHVFCSVPFSEHLVRGAGNDPAPKIDSLAFWCGHARANPGTLSEARQYVVYADASRFQDPLEEFSGDLQNALQHQAPIPNSSSSVREVLAFCAHEFHLAEVLMQEGFIGAGLKHATECAQLRTKLVNTAFHTHMAGGMKQFEASGPSATYAWPALFSGVSKDAASQWHIMGGYLESLMQVGILSQILGIADDAERNFREGLWVSQAKGLRFAQALFASCLGEVHRKEHLWESANDNLQKALQLFQEVDASSCCSHCMVAGKASTELRLGDLARRRPKTYDSLDAALGHYDSALAVLKELPGGIPYRSLVVKCNSRSKKQDSTTKNLFHKFVDIDMGNSSMSAWIAYKWEQLGRRLLGKILLQQGKCYFKTQEHDQAEEAFLRALSVLRVSDCCISPPHWNWLKPSSSFPLEESAVLYHLSLLLLWLKHDGRTNSRGPSITWLHRAFVSSSAAPPLFRKISQLLAVIHAFPPPDILDFPMSKKSAELKEAAVYFHQASIGSRTRQQHLFMLESKLHTLTSQEKEECLEKMMKALRVLPEDNIFPVSDLQHLRSELPSTTVCCISFVEQESTFLLQDGDVEKSRAWLLVSRFADGDVLICKLPIDFQPTFEEDLSSTDETLNIRHRSILESDVLLRCVLPELASILRESRDSTSKFSPLTVEEKNQWWKWRTGLDARLSTFLRNVEDSWFGTWKCLLLGEPLQNLLAQAFRKKAKELCRLFKSKAFLGLTKLGKPPEEALVKVLLQGMGHLEKEQLRAGVSRVFGDDGSETMVDSAIEAFESGYMSIFCDVKKPKTRKNTRAAASVPEETVVFSPQSFEREPVQLVLDGRLQGFPWENLPVMRKFEAYRMPSLGSIRALAIYHKYTALPSFDLSESLGRLNLRDEELSKPYVNPFNAFYLLNPGGDLETTQAAFEEWFRRQKGWEGKAGQVPTIEEYIAGLQQHDLFVYLGHGSGDQYLPEKYIRKLDNCPAALLMGCSSGRFSSRGDYEPVGVPLSYLMAGCPVAIANLWDVTDGDIDRFSRKLLHQWLDKQEDATTTSTTTTTSTVVETKVKAGPLRKCRTAKVETVSSTSSSTVRQEWEDIPIGPSVAAGRDACKLPYLIGASPVCFGVPTMIRRSNADLASG